MAHEGLVKSVRDYLRGSQRVRDLVGDRIVLSNLPAEMPYPALMIDLLSGSANYVMAGESCGASATLEISAIDTHKPTMMRLAEAVRQRLSGFRPGDMAGTWVNHCEISSEVMNDEQPRDASDDWVPSLDVNYDFVYHRPRPTLT